MGYSKSVKLFESHCNVVQCPKGAVAMSRSLTADMRPRKSVSASSKINVLNCGDTIEPWNANGTMV